MALFPHDWFWIVGGDESRAWSSAAQAYVQEWPADSVTPIINEAELSGVLAQHGLQGPAVRSVDVIAERERRLALGFDYDFGDERGGVHRIGTTDADMKGWDEVTKVAQAAINLGQPSAPITIVTDTGAVAITATEWQMILIAAGEVRQPVWAASFTLQAMAPIPADFTDDQYWVRPLA